MQDFQKKAIFKDYLYYIIYKKHYFNKNRINFYFEISIVKHILYIVEKK